VSQPDLAEAIARLPHNPAIGRTADELERLVIDAAYWIIAETTPRFGMATCRGVAPRFPRC